jgi:hypothetical protein
MAKGTSRFLAIAITGIVFASGAAIGGQASNKKTGDKSPSAATQSREQLELEEDIRAARAPSGWTGDLRNPPSAEFNRLCKRYGDRYQVWPQSCWEFVRSECGKQNALKGRDSFQKWDTAFMEELRSQALAGKRSGPWPISCVLPHQ